MTDHLAKAREYIGRGEEFYRKAAGEIIAARKQGFTWPAISQGVEKSVTWCKTLVTNAESGQYSAPFAGEYGRVKATLTRSSLRDAPPEEIAEMMADPKIAANVARASSIANERVEEKSRERFRESLGERNHDELEQHVKYQDAEAELFRARRAVIETLRLLGQFEMSELPDSWLEELLRTFDDIAGKVAMGRALLEGSLNESALEKLFEEA